MTPRDPLSEIDVCLAAASETPDRGAHVLFLAHARVGLTQAQHRLDNSRRILEAQEKELERTR